MAQYKIQQGDTLSALARQYGTSVDALMKANEQIKDRDLIYTDRMMNLPGQDSISERNGGLAPIGSNASLANDRTHLNSMIAREEAQNNMFAGLAPESQNYGTEIDPTTGMPVGVDLSGQPTLGELFGGINQKVTKSLSDKNPPTTNPYSIMEGQSSIIPEASPIKEIIQDSFVKVNEFDQYIKGGEFQYDSGKLIDDFKKSAKKIAEGTIESSQEAWYTLRKDFAEELNNVAQNNNLSIQDLVESLDMDWLYEATGVRNKRKSAIDRSRRSDAYKRDLAISNLPEGEYGNTTFANGGLTDLAQQAQNVANQGRYGDSMLMHVNPAEVAGLSQVMPLTRNPETGQPEAFLPFLIPLLGSMAGSAMFGGTLGTLGAGALGGGLAEWARTGSFKKGLLGGLTGLAFGGLAKGLTGNLAAKGAEAAATAGTTAAGTGATTSAASKAIGQAAIKSGEEALKAGTGPGFFKTALSGLSNNPNAINPLSSADKFSAVGSALSSPAFVAPASVGMGTTAVLESQEQFARDVEERRLQKEEDKRQLYLDYPEPILYSGGGITNFEHGGTTTSDSGNSGSSLTNLFKMLSPAYSLATTGDYLGFLGGDTSKMGLLQSVNELNKKNRETEKARLANQNSNTDEGVLLDANLISSMMAQGGLTGYDAGGYTDMDHDRGKGRKVNTFDGDKQRFTPARQAYDINPDFMAGFQPETMYFNPKTVNAPAVATSTGKPRSVTDTYEGSKGGYNTTGLAVAPLQTINPFEKFTGSAPQGLIETGFNPYPTPIPSTPVAPTESTNPVRHSETFYPSDVMGGSPIENSYASGYSREGIEEYNTGVPMDGYEDYQPVSYSGSSSQSPISNVIDNYNDYLGGTNMSGMSPDEINSGSYNPSMVNPEPIIDYSAYLGGNRGGSGGGRNRKAEGGQINLPNKGLEALNQVAPDVVNRMGFAIGGLMPENIPQEEVPQQAPEQMQQMQQQQMQQQAPEQMPEQMPEQSSEQIMADPVTQETILFITGESDNEQIVNEFINKYGNEMFMQLRDFVLKSLTNPNAQTEGLIAGNGNGGMDDDLRGKIGANEEIAVSQDEFIVPADVVSALGDGSSDAGSNQLYGMMDRVRQAKTGGTTQPPKININQMMPA